MDAATNIQDAVNVALSGTVLVASGVYDQGMALATGVTPNRVSITNPVVVQSVAGRDATGSPIPRGTGSRGGRRTGCGAAPRRFDHAAIDAVGIRPTALASRDLDRDDRRPCLRTTSGTARWRRHRAL